jgi:hypothetical protein
MKTIDIETHIQVMEAMTKQINSLKERINELNEEKRREKEYSGNVSWANKALEEENEILKIKIKKSEEGKK